MWLTPFAKPAPVVMGPGLRRDDTENYFPTPISRKYFITPG
jgi:hypothetical protein